MLCIPLVWAVLTMCRSGTVTEVNSSRQAGPYIIFNSPAERVAAELDLRLQLGKSLLFLPVVPQACKHTAAQSYWEIIMGKGNGGITDEACAALCICDSQCWTHIPSGSFLAVMDWMAIAATLWFLGNISHRMIAKERAWKSVWQNSSRRIEQEQQRPERACCEGVGRRSKSRNGEGERRGRRRTVTEVRWKGLSVFLLKICFFDRQRYTEGERETETIYLLVNSPNGLNGCSWARRQGI